MTSHFDAQTHALMRHDVYDALVVLHHRDSDVRCFAVCRNVQVALRARCLYEESPRLLTSTLQCRLTSTADSSEHHVYSVVSKLSVQSGIASKGYPRAAT